MGRLILKNIIRGEDKLKLEIYNKAYYLKEYDKFNVKGNLIENYETQYEKRVMDILNCFLNDNLSIIFSYYYVN